ESIREAVTARTARIGFALAGLAVIGWFVTAKLALFANLEYLGDVFSALQSSTSFAKGRPLLYENGYGAQAALHNYYVLPLFYPLTSWLAARGLFVGLALALAAAFLRV